MIVEYIRSKIPKEETRAFGQPIQAHKLHCRLLLIVLAIICLGYICLGYELSRCADAPEHCILRIQWNSRQGHLEGFRKSPEFGAFFRHVKPFVASTEEMCHYEVTLTSKG
jgi:Antibiotic biosynthesis monooxygenase